MIAGFKDADTKLLYETGKSKRIPANLRRVVVKRLLILNAAVELSNLRVPPRNKLEALTGDRKGQHSIRVNDQYRICSGITATRMTLKSSITTKLKE